MYVKILRTLRGPEISLDPGDTPNLPDEIADALIQADAAEPFTPPEAEIAQDALVAEVVAEELETGERRSHAHHEAELAALEATTDPSQEAETNPGERAAYEAYLAEARAD